MKAQTKHAGGRPKTLKVCACGRKFGAREMRKHKPRCPKVKR